MEQVFPVGASRNNTLEHKNLLLCSRASYTGYVVDWENGWGRGAHERRGEREQKVISGASSRAEAARNKKRKD